MGGLWHERGDSARALLLIIEAAQADVFRAGADSSGYFGTELALTSLYLLVD